jgi:hypothetical protein
MTTSPGRYFADHRTRYLVSLAGSGGTALYATWRAYRCAGIRRVPWLALAVLEAAIAVGIVHTTAKARGRGAQAVARSDPRSLATSPMRAAGRQVSGRGPMQPSRRRTARRVTFPTGN